MYLGKDIIYNPPPCPCTRISVAMVTSVRLPATGDLADLLPCQGVDSSGNADIPCIVVTKLTVAVGTKREDTTILRREGGRRERERTKFRPTQYIYTAQLTL
jgi:hypothetical protein